MNFFIENWLLITVAFVSGALLVWPAVSRGGGSGSVNPTDAVMLMNREKAIVIDVCDPQEYAGGHIVGARNVPMDKLETQLPGTVKNKATPLIMVCASGMRSNRAAGVARKLGYEKVQSLAGGMGAWRSASLPVEKS